MPSMVSGPGEDLTSLTHGSLVENRLTSMELAVPSFFLEERGLEKALLVVSVIASAMRMCGVMDA